MSTKLDRLLVIVTAGGGSHDENRARLLTDGLANSAEFVAVDHKHKSSSARQISALLQQPWDLVYLEGTGLAGGLPLIAARVGRKQPFLVSSGDPISGYFRTTLGPAVALPSDVYERLLYRSCGGFVGWTPYLTGRALQMGARRGLTVEGGADVKKFRPASVAERAAARARFGLDPQHLVCAVVGSLAWSKRQRYAYGLELIESLKRVTRADLSVLIVGDGDGRRELEARVPAYLRSRVVFTGRLAPSDVVEAIWACDIGFVTQTIDALGNYRLSTKLPEYLACGVPVAMSPVPGFYDYVSEAGWALPAAHPAAAAFHTRCAAWLDGVSREAALALGGNARALAEARFSYELLRARFQTFALAVAAEPGPPWR